MKKTVFLILLVLVLIIYVTVISSTENEQYKSKSTNNLIDLKSKFNTSDKLHQSGNTKISIKKLTKKVKKTNSINKKSEASNNDDFKYDDEKFNETLGIEPLDYDKLADISGIELKERLQLLNSTFNRAIEQNEDLSDTPLWFDDEMEILLTRYFSTIGKSTHKTQVSDELKRKKREYRELMENAIETKNMELVKKLPEIKRRYFEQN